jgi:hypothetical protein
MLLVSSWPLSSTKSLSTYNLILQLGDLNKQQTDFLLSKVELPELKKNDYLS